MDLPDNPAGRTATWVLSRFGMDLSEDEIRERFAASFLQQIPPDTIQAFVRNLGELLPVEVANTAGGELQQRAILQTSQEALSLLVTVEPHEPHLISGLLVRPQTPSVADIVRSSEPLRAPDAIERNVGSWTDSLRGGGAGAVCAVRHGGDATVQAFGGVSSDSIFEIGSITKPATATLLAYMVASGDVRLDDRVAAHLPPGASMPEGAADVTLLELAMHSSGLPRLPVNLEVGDERDPYASFTIDALFVGLAATPILGRGEVAYSNLGYALLGQVLARAAETSYENLLTQRVLVPLKMNDARVGLDPSSEAWRVRGYHEGRVVPYWTRTATAPAGGIEASAADVVTFAAAHADAAPDSPLAQTHIRRTRYGDGYIGLAWLVVPTDRGDVFWHNGGTGGFRSFVGFHPASGTAVAVLSNVGDGDGPDAAGAAVLGALINAQ